MITKSNIPVGVGLALLLQGHEVRGERSTRYEKPADNVVAIVDHSYVGSESITFVPLANIVAWRTSLRTIEGAR